MEFRDYYATLGVAKTATEKEIKQAYRKLARKFHPDVNPGDKKAESRFKEINEAYEVLGDPAKRKKYDELGANWRMYENMPPGYGAPGGFGGAGTPGGATWTVDFGQGAQQISPEELNELFGGDAAGEGGPFSDFFRTFFGGGEPRTGRAGRTGPRRRAGHDLEQEIHLTLEEAFQGTRRRLTIKSDGHARSVDVRIPPGVKDGARLRVAGEGEPGSGGAAAGDLFLRIRVEPHARFERRGQDLHVTLQVPLLTAILGGEADVPTLSGKTLRLKIPETTQNGQVFRLRGHGMPNPSKADGTGDLYATVTVELPRHLSPEERQHYEALARTKH